MPALFWVPRTAGLAAVPLLLLFASEASGAWVVETVYSAPVPNPVLVLDQAGIPHVAHNCVQPCVSSRSGGTWTVDQLTTPAGPAKALPGETNIIWFSHASLALENEPRVLYYKAPETEIWYARRESGTWTYERLSASGAAGGLAFDRDGRGHAVFYDQESGYRYAVEGPSGWQTEAAPGAGPLEIDDAGRAHVAFLQGGARWARRNEAGWIEEVIEAGAIASVSLALDGAGEPHVSYSDESGRVRYARRDAGVWAIETVAPNAGGGRTALALGAGGTPFIAYYDVTTGEFCFARRESGAWTREVIEPGYHAHETCSMAIDAAGRPHIAFYDGSSRRIRYATSNTPVTGVDLPDGTHGFGVAGIGPNPLRAGGAIDLALRLDAPRRITVELLDVSGRRVAAREPELVAAGTQRMSWAPQVAGAGIYFLDVRSDRGERRTARLVLVP